MASCLWMGIGDYQFFDSSSYQELSSSSIGTPKSFRVV
jgi:hypothetical protein